MRRWARVRRGVVGVVAGVVMLGAAGCDPQLAGSRTGPTNLYIEFPDVQDLVRGHTVQIGNVVVGSIREVELVRSEAPGTEGKYAARARVQIVQGRSVPIGTTATLRRTSLLGEHFVGLTLPAGGGRDLPAYKDGDAFHAEDPSCIGPPRTVGGVPSCTIILDDFEDVALNAAQIFGAIAGRDLTTIVNSLHEGLAGRGAQLNALIGELSAVVTALADQRAELAATIDGLAALGSVLAPNSAAVGTLIDRLATTTAMLADHRQRIVTALTDLADLAGSLNDVVLEPHAERLQQLLADLDPVVATLADNRQLLEDLIGHLLNFTERLPQAIPDTGRLEVFAWLQLPMAGASGVAEPVPVDPTDILTGAGLP